MIIDFELIQNTHSLTKEQEEELADLQPTFVNGHCHSLTALIAYFYPEAKVKVLHTTDCGIIHSLIEIKPNVYVDASGITNNINEIIGFYSPHCTPNSITMQDSTVEEIIRISLLEDYDITHAFEFWQLIQGYYNIKEFIHIPNDSLNEEVIERILENSTA